MSPLRRSASALVGAATLAVAGLAPIAVAPSQAAGAPAEVVIKDSRTSSPSVDISRVVLDASWYWASEQNVLVRVPNGLHAGHQVTVWFDLNGDSTPDGHYRLRLRAPKKAGSHRLRLVQDFRRGGGWTTGGTGVSCTDDEDGAPVNDAHDGDKTTSVGLDLWDCLGATKPGSNGSGAWRASVRVSKGHRADMAPNKRRWSPVVAGWGPCDPSGGPC